MFRMLSSMVRCGARRGYSAECEIAHQAGADIHPTALTNHLRDCVERAKRDVPAYRESLADVDPTRIDSLASFQSLVPLLDKDVVKHDPERFLSDRAPAKLRTVRTGGSTGTPMRFFLDADAVRRQKLDMCRGRRWWGLDHRRDCHVLLWGHGASFAPGWRGRLQAAVMRIKDALLGRERLSAYDLGPTTAHAFARRLERSDPDFLQGYASALEVLAELFAAAGIQPQLPSLKLVVSTAEPLLKRQADVIERMFGAPVANEYGCSEIGVLAYSCPHCGRIHPLSDHVHLEVLNPVLVDGRRQGEIAVTTFLHHSAPLIRYRLGDIAQLNDTVTHCPLGESTIEAIAGRTHDRIHTPDGGTVHGEYFTHVMDHIQGVERFQVVQERLDSLTIRVVTNPDWTPDSETAIRAGVARRFGDDVDLRIERLAELAREASGKFRWIVSHVSADALPRAASTPKEPGP